MARYPLWTDQENESLIARYLNVQQFPDASAIARDFPNRSRQAVKIHLKYLRRHKLLPFCEEREGAVSAPEVATKKPSRPVLYKKGDNVALPFVPSLLGADSDYEKRLIPA